MGNKISKLPNLPPLVGGIADGSVYWKKIESIDYNFLGYFLSTHLIIEHYLTGFLKGNIKILNWDNANLTANQKIELFSKYPISEPYNFIAEIKHLNKLRNKISHKIDYQITDDDLLPFKYYLAKVLDTKDKIPESKIDILSMFSLIICTYMASVISYEAKNRKEKNT